MAEVSALPDQNVTACHVGRPLQYMNMEMCPTLTVHIACTTLFLLIDDKSVVFTKKPSHTLHSGIQTCCCDVAFVLWGYRRVDFSHTSLSMTHVSDMLYNEKMSAHQLTGVLQEGLEYNNLTFLLSAEIFTLLCSIHPSVFQ